MIDSRQLAKNFREAVFILACLFLVYLFVALTTYHADDPSFGNTKAVSTPAAVNNWGGVTGALMSALLLEWFGRSAYLLVIISAFCFYSILLRPLNLSDTIGWSWALLGVLFFMITSSSLEYLRFHHNDGLPAGAGGLVGHLIAKSMIAHLGVFGASLLLMGTWVLSWCLAANLSWFSFFEEVGRVTEWLCVGMFRRANNAKAAARARRAAAAAEEYEDDEEDYEEEEAEEEESDEAGDEASDEAGEGEGADEADEVRAHQTPKRGWFGFSKRDREKAADSESETPAAGEEGVLINKRASSQFAAAAANTRKRRVSKSKIGRKQPSELFEGKTAAAVLPSTDLLDAPKVDGNLSEAAMIELRKLIEESLGSFNISVEVVNHHPGPVVTRFDLKPATGVKGVQIVNLSKDLARSLSVPSIRVMETIPGTNFIGLEIPNAKRSIVGLSEIIAAPAFQQTDANLPLALGKSAAGEPTVADLAAMPHLLVAGSTGSGKSVFINSVLLSLLYSRTPDDIRLLLIDPKMLELATYAEIPHLLAPVVTDMELAPVALNWAVNEMERRYRIMADAAVRHISSYNKMVADGTLLDEQGNPAQRMQYIVVVIDELADLMMVSGKKVELFINRLAQKARAAGIHLILATQRPSVDVITGLIKANVPSRISFQVASKVDSRTILDQMGAESLLGKGDMLYLSSGAGVPQRLHGAYISDSEVERVTESVRGSYDEVQYLTDFTEPTVVASTGGDDEGDAMDGEQDMLYDEAVELVIKSKRVSISLIQRRLRIGYNRAARLVEAMEHAKVVSPANDLGMRKLLQKE